MREEKRFISRPTPAVQVLAHYGRCRFTKVRGGARHLSSGEHAATSLILDRVLKARWNILGISEHRLNVPLRGALVSIELARAVAFRG